MGDKQILYVVVNLDEFLDLKTFYFVPYVTSTSRNDEGFQPGLGKWESILITITYTMSYKIVEKLVT